MADTATASSLAARQAVIALARDKIGCHYVWGGAGNTPGEQDGAFYRKNAAKMHDNDANSPQKGHADHGRKQPIVLAAYCRVDGYKVCAGRSGLTDVMALEHGDPKDPLLITSEYDDRYTWPRPDMTIDSNTLVWGESCEGIRHFDCIGFVNWCLSTGGRLFHHSIQQVINETTVIASGKAAVSKADPDAGDILTIGAHHIGFATGDGTAVHASSTHKGVIETDLEGGGWDRVGRFGPKFWGT